jgi:hypothetical protein
MDGQSASVGRPRIPLGCVISGDIGTGRERKRGFGSRYSTVSVAKACDMWLPSRVTTCSRDRRRATTAGAQFCNGRASQTGLEVAITVARKRGLGARIFPRAERSSQTAIQRMVVLAQPLSGVTLQLAQSSCAHIGALLRSHKCPLRGRDRARHARCTCLDREKDQFIPTSWELWAASIAGQARRCGRKNGSEICQARQPAHPAATVLSVLRVLVMGGSKAVRRP